MNTISPWTRRAAGWTGALALAAATLLMAGCERRDAADTGNATGTSGTSGTTGTTTDSTTGSGSMGSSTTMPSGTTGTTGTPGSTDTITPPMDPASAPMPAASQ